MTSTSDALKQPHDALDSVKLHTLNDPAELNSCHFESLEDSTSGEGALNDPAVTASHLTA
ncbi:hypothetical protein V8B97DRAFT_1941815 [Scleroderma yunnanense]